MKRCTWDMVRKTSLFLSKKFPVWLALFQVTADPQPTGRHSHSACLWRDTLVIAGGLASDEKWLDDCWALNLAEHQPRWRRLSIKLPVPWCVDSCFFFGGGGGGCEKTPINITECCHGACIHPSHGKHCSSFCCLHILCEAHHRAYCSSIVPSARLSESVRRCNVFAHVHSPAVIRTKAA